MASTPEGKLQVKIKKRLKTEWPSIRIVKRHGGPHQAKNTIDFEGCLFGLYFGLEVKVPPNTPTKYQKKTIKEIREAGGVADVVTSPEEAYQVLRKAVKNVKLYGRPYKQTTRRSN